MTCAKQVIITEGPVGSRAKYNIRSREVHDPTAGTIQKHVGLADHGPKCTASVVISILLYAASRITSVFDACQRLGAAPSDQAVRDALRETLPPIDETQRRFTVAMTRVLYGEAMKEVVQHLLQQAGRIGVKPRYLLLDRGFYSVEVVRYLQAARYPFLMPVARRGRKPRHP